MSVRGPIVALCGGVGAARFLRGLCAVLPPEEVVAIINTGDDREFYGVHVSPDLDIVTYTLAGQVDEQRGWGLAGDRTALVQTLAALGHETWFQLGDRDYAVCLYRTLRLREGIGLAQIADEIRRHFDVATRILPMSEGPCPTLVQMSGGRFLHFEEYLVRDGAPSDVVRVDLATARAAHPAPGVLEAIASARAILFCPSNPVVSIGPILAIPDIRAALLAAKAPRIAVSPIVAGAPIKGPADHLLRAVGAEVSARGVAALYREFIHGFVLDKRDAEQTRDIEALGLRALAVETLMKNRKRAAQLASAALELAESLA